MDLTVGTELRASIERSYSDVHVIVAPPRSCSTLLARIFWNCPQIAFYAHEPFDGTYHRGDALSMALAKLMTPVDLTDQRGLRPRCGTGLLVKDLPFQVGAAFPLLASLTRHPIVFLIRDPRLTIASRMRMRVRIGQPAVFPVVESGWQLLADQVQYCRAHAVPYVVVDATELRRDPAAILRGVFAAVGLSYDDGVLYWAPTEEIDFGLAVRQQQRWNERVLGSTKVEPPSERVPELTEFPVEGGMRGHVEAALAIYRALRATPELVRARQEGGEQLGGTDA
jgi:Sulfotransferase domain